MAALVQAAAERFGRLDVGINNAGIAPPMKALIDTDEADLDLSFAVNAKGVFFGMKHQIRQMLAQLGRDPERRVDGRPAARRSWRPMRRPSMRWSPRRRRRSNMHATAFA